MTAFKSKFMLLTATFFAVLCLVACDDNSRQSSRPQTGSPPVEQPEVPAQPPVESPTPRIDLSVVSVRVPNRVTHNGRFQTRVTVENLRGPEAIVASVNLRITVRLPTGVMDLSAGSGSVRNLKPGSRQTIEINSRAPNRSGMGTLTATIKAVLAEDPNSFNDKATTRVVVD